MKTKAAVLFINGQSNATAHQQYLPLNERVTMPLKNVFSLDRNPNQSFDIADVVWSGWTSCGKNLGETQDNTACLAHYFAKLWQNAIDSGKDLPDLYIVQISVGSQGIINGMWNRDKKKTLKPGILGEVDIALLPLATNINKLVMKNLTDSGKNPKIIGWHWIGCEQEIWDEAYLRDDFSERYTYHFDTMLSSMGENVPVYLYKTFLLGGCKRYNLPVFAMECINNEIISQAERLNAKVIDVRNCPHFDEADEEYYGILAEDRAHYLSFVQEWFATEFFNDVIKNEF